MAQEGTFGEIGSGIWVFSIRRGQKLAVNKVVFELKGFGVQDAEHLFGRLA